MLNQRVACAEHPGQEVGDACGEPAVGAAFTGKLFQQMAWVGMGPGQPGNQCLGKLGSVSQPQIQALASNRVQGLRRIANGNGLMVDE